MTSLRANPLFGYLLCLAITCASSHQLFSEVYNDDTDIVTTVSVCEVPCMALTLEGFDQHLAARHGLDGLYIYEHCHNGQPLYVRRPTRDRHLWYSSQYWDWNVSPGARGGNEQAVHVFSSSRELFEQRSTSGAWFVNASLAPGTIPKDSQLLLFHRIYSARVKCSVGAAAVERRADEEHDEELAAVHTDQPRLWGASLQMPAWCHQWQPVHMAAWAAAASVGAVALILALFAWTGGRTRAHEHVAYDLTQPILGVQYVATP